MVSVRRVSLLIGVLGLFVALPVAAVGRQPTPSPTPTQNSGQGLEISPPVMELAAKPGETVTANIRLRNITSGELVVNGQADDFGAKGEDGDPQILLDETEATRYSLKFWVQSVPSFRLVPQEVKTAQVKIVVPANAEPGGHYGVIRFTGVPPELEGTGVSLSASIGTLVLMRVAGDIKEDLAVEEFFVGRNGKKGWFFENGPLELSERLRNTGSVHVKPVGFVEVFDSFGKRVSQMPISDPARNVLPDSVRRFDQKLETKGMFGRYTAKFSATYGSDKTLGSRTISFWVVPYKLIAVLLLLLITLIYLLRWALRRYNRHIIAQAKGGQSKK